MISKWGRLSPPHLLQKRGRSFDIPRFWGSPQQMKPRHKIILFLCLLIFAPHSIGRKVWLFLIILIKLIHFAALGFLPSVGLRPLVPPLMLNYRPRVDIIILICLVLSFLLFHPRRPTFTNKLTISYILCESWTDFHGVGASHCLCFCLCDRPRVDIINLIFWVLPILLHPRRPTLHSF